MPVLETFLSSIATFVDQEDSVQLASYLKVEPPLPDEYRQLAQELQSASTEVEFAWPGFNAFMKEYLEFWRDVNFEDLLRTHAQLSSLVNACITALSHPSGLVILPTAIQLSTALAKLAITLDSRPDLTRRIAKDDSRKTLVEGTAESIQRAFTMCLTERSTNRNGMKDGKPDGKKIGIYSFANLVLKLLFQCRKTRLANQLFTNISQHSPPLYLYPASQRVTYLYYLGRFFFSNSHFYRAQVCLQEAYDQCHVAATSQRRLILIHLITSNLILGRFPSARFLSRPECTDILPIFAPIAQAIRKGDLAGFKRALGPEAGNERWLFQRGLLLPLLYRAEVLVWRSLARRTFLLTYQFPVDPNSRKAPTLDLVNLVAAAHFCQKSLEGTNRGVIFGDQQPDLAEIEAIVANLVSQGLLHGFVSHNLSRFAILGAKQRGGPLKAGFPPPWEVINARSDRGVPGWVKTERMGMMGGVVNLSGARPVGSGAV